MIIPPFGTSLLLGSGVLVGGLITSGFLVVFHYQVWPSVCRPSGLCARCLESERTARSAYGYRIFYLRRVLGFYTGRSRENIPNFCHIRVCVFLQIWKYLSNSNFSFGGVRFEYLGLSRQCTKISGTTSIERLWVRTRFGSIGVPVFWLSLFWVYALWCIDSVRSFICCVDCLRGYFGFYWLCWLLSGVAW